MFRISSSTGDYDPLIRINNAKNITITGGGVVDGQGGIWWPCAQSPNTGNPPCNNRHRQVKKIHSRGCAEIILRSPIVGYFLPQLLLGTSIHQDLGVFLKFTFVALK